MKKKYYFRLSICFFLYLLVPLAIISIGVYTLYNFNDFSLLSVIIAVCAIFFSCIYIIMLCYYHITFDNTKVTITSDLSPKIEKIQYACSIFYEDIIKLDLIVSSNDSRNKKIQFRWISSIMPKTYIQIDTKDKKYRLYVTAFSNRQKKKIINEIKKRCEAIGNHIDAEDTETMYQNYKKKKKAVYKNFNDKNNILDDESDSFINNDKKEK